MRSTISENQDFQIVAWLNVIRYSPQTTSKPIQKSFWCGLQVFSDCKTTRQHSQGRVVDGLTLVVGELVELHMLTIGVVQLMII